MEIYELTTNTLLLILLCIQKSLTWSPENVPLVVYNLADETPADSLIGNIEENLASQGHRNLEFVLATSESFQYFSDYFRVTTNGDLLTLRSIDRDNKNEVCGPLACCHLMVCQIDADVVTIYRPPEFALRDHNPIQEDQTQLSVKLLIRINDANDNAPRFIPAGAGTHVGVEPLDPHQFHIYLREGDVSSTEKLPVAIDADATQNGIVRYELIQSGQNISKPSLDIRMHGSSKLPAPTQSNELIYLGTPELILLRSLDYEEVSDRELYATLYAIDGGSPSLTGSLSVIIHLMDVNDNTPIFTHSNEDWQIIVPENLTHNKTHTLFTVKAHDADSGENGRVSYAISPLAGLEATKKFSLDSTTGSIRINQPLDYEVYSERRFVLPIIAKDSGNPQRSATMSLLIELRDINDNIPTLVVQENVTVLEGEIPTKPVLKFYIKDEDEASQGKVHCNQSSEKSSDPELVAGQHHLRLHAVSQTVFFVFVKQPIDYEKKPIVGLLIDCFDLANTTMDGGDLPYTTLNKALKKQTIRVTVAVGDRNDNPPMFLKEKYLARIPEHSPKGTVVIQVEASDADGGEFGILTYQLGRIEMKNPRYGNDQTRLKRAFELDTTNGKLSILEPSILDREFIEVLHVHIVARDKGDLSTTTVVVVELTDVNDNSPELMSSNHIRLEENQRVDTLVAIIHYVDTDKGHNARIHLRSKIELSGSEANRYMRLTPDPNFHYATALQNFNDIDELVGDGEIKALLVSQMPVDRESYATLFFELIAFDEGDPVQSVTSIITIEIGDQNDNSPILIFPSPSRLSSENLPSVYTNSPSGSLVTQLRATDADQGDNATIQYRIYRGGNGTQYFRINETTGELRSVWIPGTFGEKFIDNSRPSSQPRPGLYELKIRISDRGSPSKSSEYSIYIQIGPENVNLRIIPDQKLSLLPEINESEKPTSGQTLLLLIILSCTLTVMSVLASLCWLKLCRKSKHFTESKNSKIITNQAEYGILSNKNGHMEEERGKDLTKFVDTEFNSTQTFHYPDVANFNSMSYKSGFGNGDGDYNLVHCYTTYASDILHTTCQSDPVIGEYNLDNLDTTTSSTSYPRRPPICFSSPTPIPRLNVLNHTELSTYNPICETPFVYDQKYSVERPMRSFGRPESGLSIFSIGLPYLNVPESSSHNHRSVQSTMNTLPSPVVHNNLSQYRLPFDVCYQVNA